MTNGCFKYGKKNHMIKNCPIWEVEWKKEKSERRNRKKEQVHDKKNYNKRSSKAMVSTWFNSLRARTQMKSYKDNSY